ncbi:MAG TPA: DUF3343 domain-containing protein [Candidatus Blautia stercoravium]|nr:DUF3343 domain-containing protein [Candidatus Blautia stercoravium]
MREKVKRLVLSFSTTTQAMAAEQWFQGKEMPGRLIPLPGSISAECGLAWCTDIDQKGAVEQAAEEGAIQIQGIHEAMLYERK